jgi:hypothetical protein
MKKLLAALFAPLFLLAACATDGITPGQPTPIVSQVNVDKAMYVGESAWKGALVMVDAAVSSGVLKGDNAARVRVTLAQAKAKRDQAWSLYDLGNKTGALAAITQVQSLVADLGTLVRPTR